ncbi:MAG: FKBP-type peptidyl-prolyl cis-trans isomerase [Cyclobacteriaceae bacterium]
MKIEKYLKIVLFLSLPLLLNSCFDTEDPNANLREESDQLISEYLEDNNIQATKSNFNYYYEPITENSAGKDVETGDVVGVYYKISNLSGQHIDSLTESMGDPLPFLHVANNSAITIPPVVNLGLTWMKEGETYRFYVPSYLAYGSYQNDTLMSSYTNLKMDVTVAYIADSTTRANMEDEMIQNYLNTNSITNYQTISQGVYYYQTQAGEGSTPETGAFVKIKYKGFLLENGKVFDQVEAGEDPYNYRFKVDNVIDGFALGIGEMVKGEKGVVIIPSFSGYGAQGNTAVLLIGGQQASARVLLPQKIAVNYQNYIPPFSPIVFELEMLE